MTIVSEPKKEAGKTLPSPASREGSTFEPVFEGQTARLNKKKWLVVESLVVVAHRMILADLIVSIARTVITMRRLCYPKTRELRRY